MSDYIVACMEEGNLKTIKDYVESLNSINDNIYIDDENCMNVLHLAVGLDSEHREEVIELLVQMRADLNCPGKSDNINDIRPLHLAAMWGYDMTVKLLLFHGADASLRDTNGLSPVDYASIFDNYLCISLLLRYGSLNSTASAWSAIMDSSMGESNLDSSYENCLYTTALDSGGDDHHDRSLQASNLFDSIHDDGVVDDDYDPLDLIRDEDIDLNIDNCRLRLELKRLGRNPGPITGTRSRERVYSPEWHAGLSWTQAIL